MIEVGNICQCSACILCRKVNNIKTLKDLLECRDRLKSLRKYMQGKRIDEMKRVIDNKLNQIPA